MEVIGEMVDITNTLLNYGVVGIAGGILFKKFLEDSESDKEYFREKIEQDQKTYREQLEMDRQTYLDSINAVTSSIGAISNKLEEIETDVKDIKNKLEK